MPVVPVGTAGFFSPSACPGLRQAGRNTGCYRIEQFCLSYIMAKGSGWNFMKKGRWWTAVVLTLGLLAVVQSVTESGTQDTGIAAARIIAGEGMVRLVSDSMGEPQVWGALQRVERGECEECPRVALTFDDGPSKKYTPLLLDGLKERGIHVSFFLMGKNIQGNEDLVRRIQEEGHLIGNHTYNHIQLNRVSAATAKQEIEKTSNQIYEITGNYPVYLRPPFGSWRKDLELSVEMFPVMWSIDTLDWKSQNVNSVVEIVERQVADGSIILMHDGYGTSVEAAFRIIDTLVEAGYQFVTVDALLEV